MNRGTQLRSRYRDPTSAEEYVCPSRLPGLHVPVTLELDDVDRLSIAAWGNQVLQRCVSKHQLTCHQFVPVQLPRTLITSPGLALCLAGIP